MLPQRAPPQKTYDFGLLPSAAALARIDFPAGIVLGGVSAAPWLQNTDIFYRFAFTDAAQLRSYTRSRWVARPAKLLGERLTSALAESTPACKQIARCANLNVTIQRFEQVFTAAHSAHVVMQARVSLTDQSQQTLYARRVFRLRAKSETADAPGAVDGFITVSDQFIHSLAQWLQRVTNAPRQGRRDERALGLLGHPG